MSSLVRNSAFDTILEREVYQRPALMPLSPWLALTKPGKPKLTVAKGEPSSRLEIRWTTGGSGKPWLWLLQTRTAGEWTTEVLPGTTNSRVWNGAPPGVVAVSAVNRNGDLSAPSVLQARGSTR
jgi:hypothetical protein